jgi:para-aminobenzoate synthetase component 1
MPRAEYSEVWTSRPARALSPRDFFSLPSRRSFALLYGDGPKERWTVFAEDPLLDLGDPTQLDSVAIAPCRGRPAIPRFDLIGHVSYEWGQSREPLLGPCPPDPLGLPDFRFRLYRRTLVLDRETGTLHECERSGPRATEPEDFEVAAGRFSARLVDSGETPGEYESKVEVIRELIRRGELYQANLTRQEEWEIAGDLLDFARSLYDANPAPLSATIQSRSYSIVSSSPERLISLRSGRLVARPIKGTAPRGATPELDAELAASLLASEKDVAELAMIVDLLRNDLSRCCAMPSVRVDAFPTLESYANVHHLVATISGDAPRALTPAALLEAIFPGGSVTGCPKLASMRAIRELERSPRSIYTGALGWMAADGSELDLNIPIRTAWRAADRLRFGVGGAVTWDSDPRAEYEETVHKGRSLRTCLGS